MGVVVGGGSFLTGPLGNASGDWQSNCNLKQGESARRLFWKSKKGRVIIIFPGLCTGAKKNYSKKKKKVYADDMCMHNAKCAC